MMRGLRAGLKALICGGMIAGLSPAAMADAHSGPLELETMGAFFANGQTVRAEYPCIPGGFCGGSGGDIRVQQVRVDFMIPTDRRDLPIVTVPGLGVRATAFLGTLDGREGWAQFFARRSFAVYATVQSNVASAGFNPEPFNTAKINADTTDQPPLFHWEPNLMWSLFGFGPQFPDLYDETRFTVETDLPVLLDSVTTADNSITAEQRQAGITSVLEKTGRGILITHSQSGPTGFAVARDRSDLVAAHISIEPVGCSTEAADAEAFTSTPILTVFADRTADRGPWSDWTASCGTFTDNVNAAGGNATRIVLPDDLGIRGNTHFMMVEDNSDEIAQIILDWIEENVTE